MILSLEVFFFITLTHHTSPHFSKSSQALSHLCSALRERGGGGGGRWGGKGGEQTQPALRGSRRSRVFRLFIFFLTWFCFPETCGLLELEDSKWPRPVHCPDSGGDWPNITSSLESGHAWKQGMSAADRMWRKRKQNKGPRETDSREGGGRSPCGRSPCGPSCSPWSTGCPDYAVSLPLSFLEPLKKLE